ncbi:MAG: glucosamine inositolphosphorylceramide transferase family protein, partial [Planctomycetota bacterium]
GRVARIRAEPFSYYADPFIWQRAGATWLFVEQVRYFENRGRLVAIPLDTELRPGRPRPVLPLRCHASFPYLFEHAGQLYMVPETSAHRYVDLFVCERFPDRWRRVRRLIYGVDAADSVVFRHQGLWWLLTSLRDPGANLKRQLALFFTDDLTVGSWQPHPMNARRLYADRPHGGGRNAGPIFRPPGQDLLLRVMQENRRHYGDGVSLMQIEVLTKDDYRESPYTGEHEFSELAARDNPHHVSSHGDLIAWDVRDRTSYRQHLPEFAGGVRPDPRARRAGKRPPSRKRRSDGTDPYS